MSSQQSSINWAVALFILLYVFTPTAVGGFYTVLAAISTFSLSYLVLRSVKRLQFIGIAVIPVELFVLTSLITLTTTITLTLNAAFFSAIGMSEIVKPWIGILFFVFAANANVGYSFPEIKKTLVLASKTIIVGQLIVVVDQVLDVNAFSVFYDYEKTGSLRLSSSGEFQSFLRSTGTLYNPNQFAWILLQCAMTIFAFSKKANRVFWLMIVFLMILLSGSKSALGIFPLALLITWWMKGDRVIVSRRNFVMLIVISILIYLIYTLLITYPDVFPRLYVLFQLMTGEDESGGGRFGVWEARYAYFLSKDEGLISWLFGLGPIKEFKDWDNGYLYTLFRNGVFGLILHVSLLVFFTVKFYRFEDKEFSALGFQYIFTGAIVQLVFEAHASWSFMPYTFVYVGLLYSYEYSKKASYGRNLKMSNAKQTFHPNMVY